MGDVDFWPNGGHCPMPGTQWSLLGQCGLSHLRAHVSFKFLMSNILNPYVVLFLRYIIKNKTINNL